MCRFAGFVGSPRPLSDLLFDAPHSLEKQAYAPRLLIGGHVNVDGTGAAWWPEEGERPLRYVTERPPWSDPNLGALSRAIRSTTLLAAVRSATPGIGFGAEHVQPFCGGSLAGVHNGWIGGFDRGTGRDLVERIPDELFGELRVLNDSKVLFLLAWARRLEGRDLSEAVSATVLEAARMAAKRGEAAALNLGVAEAGRIVAARYSRGTAANSLFVRVGPDGAVVASEPLDGDPSWREVPAGHLVDVSDGRVEVVALEEPV